MRAVVTTAFGDPSVLEVQSVPRPESTAGDVIIAVAFSGVCRHDLLTRSGAFPYVVTPRIQGHQVTGRVVEIGVGVDPDLLGRDVTTMLHVGCGSCSSCVAGDQSRCSAQRPLFIGDELDGTYAEYLRVPAGIVVPLPPGIDLAAGAVANCTFGTAWHAIVARGRFSAGDAVAVTGATGGVGFHALKLLRYLGIEAIAVTSREAAREQLVLAGASHVVVAAAHEWADVLKRSRPARLQGVLDCVGGASCDQALRAVMPGGTVVQVGNVAGTTAVVTPALLILKEMQLIGSKSATRQELVQVLDLMAQRAIDVEVAEVVDLDGIASAHAAMEAGESSVGRIVVRVGAEAS